MALAQIKWGLSKEEFLNLTYEELDAFHYIHNHLERRQDYRFAQICYILAEVNRGKKGKAYKIEDFMPRESKHKKDLMSDVMKFAGLLKTYYG